MGTRADFYIGRGVNASWMGSIAWDGYPEGIPEGVLRSRTKNEFIKFIRDFFDSIDHSTLPDSGWPWPWDDSRTTDYAYAFDQGQVYVSCFGSQWATVDEALNGDIYDDDNKTAIFPNMKDRRQEPPLGSRRSGVLVFSTGK